mgnify:CR=1 FL=1
MLPTISRKEYTLFSRLLRVTHFQFAFALLTFLFSWGFTFQAHAEKASTEEWNISADKVSHLENPNSIIAQGNVVLTKQEKLPPQKSKAEIRSSIWADLLEEDVKETELVANEVDQAPAPEFQTTMTIKADWIAYDVELESIKAKGNVQITTKDQQLFAKEGILNLKNETGNFSDATIIGKAKTLHLEGKTIEKTGVDTYRIDDGWVITCKLEANETPPWSFSASETNVRQEGYAVLKHAKFNIKNVPIFYTPYLIVPVSTTRQTGFLFPEFSFSDNNGVGFNLPFFLNISDSADITFYPEYLTNRGFMPGAEFRYVAGADDKGIFTANYLDDKLSDPSETSYYSTTNYTHDNSDRYWVRGKVDHSFADWQTRLDIDIVSDQDYLDEFATGVTGFEKTQDRYLDIFGRGFQNESIAERENTFNTLRNWDGMWLQVNLLTVNDADTNASDTDTPLWQLPSIDFSGVVPIEETNFTFGWNTNFVDYWREDGIGGQRFDIHPSISSPIPLGAYLESRAEVSLRDTFYIVQTYGDEEWDHNKTQNRLYPEFEIDVATTLEKNYLAESGNKQSYAHQVRPYVKYGYLHDVDQENLPQFDDIDSIDSVNLITYGIDNYLNKFIGKERSSNNLNNYLELKIEQAYDLDNKVTDQPFSDIYSDLKWTPFDNTSISYKNYFDMYDGKFNRHFFEGAYRNSRGDFLSIDYSFNDAENIDQINGVFIANIINGWSVGGEIKHSISYNQTDEARGSLTYMATCWSVKFESRYTPEDTTYLMTFTLANIGFPLGVGF